MALTISFTTNNDSYTERKTKIIQPVLVLLLRTTLISLLIFKTLIVRKLKIAEQLDRRLIKCIQKVVQITQKTTRQIL